MTSSCTPPKSFELYLKSRELKLNRFNENYKKLTDKLLADSNSNENINNEIIVLFKNLNEDNETAIPSIKYEKDTLEQYRKSTKEKSKMLKDKLHDLKADNSGALTTKDSLEVNINKNRELSIKYSFIVISILVLILVSIGLLVFTKKN